MTNVRTILSDPNFRSLPPAERVKVLRSVDKAFADLPEPEQFRVVGQRQADISIPNPTGKPLGADIPDDVGISVPGFVAEFGKEAGRQAVTAFTDPRTYAAMISKRVPVMTTAVAGAEAGRQIYQHATGSPEAPQSSEDAATRIGKSAGVAALVGGVFKGAGAIDRALAQRGKVGADLATKEIDLERKLLGTQEAARKEIIGVRAQTSKETTANRQKAAEDLFMARKSTRQALAATKKQATEAQLLAKQHAWKEGQQGAEAAAPKFGPATNFPKATQGLIEKSKALFKSGIDDLYKTFRENPASQQAFDISEIKQAATEIMENSAANPPAILRKIIDGPDEVPLSMAEDFLSELKGASLARFVGRTKSQGMAARIQNELQPQIEHALESQGETGAAALRALRGGRALRRHYGKTFEDEVAPGVAKVLRQGGNPMQIVQNPVKLKSFVEQAGADGLPVLRRKLFDTTVEKSVNPQSGEFSHQKFAEQFNKFRHAVTPEQQALGDSLAKGNAPELLALEKATAQELEAIRSVSEELTGAIRGDVLAKNAALGRKTSESVRAIGERTRAERLEMRVKGEQEMGAMRDKLKSRNRLLIVGATIAGASGASLVAARMRALRNMFEVLGEDKP